MPQNCEVAARSPPLAAGRTNAPTAARIGLKERGEEEERGHALQPVPIARVRMRRITLYVAGAAVYDATGRALIVRRPLGRPCPFSFLTSQIRRDRPCVAEANRRAGSPRGMLDARALCMSLLFVLLFARALCMSLLFVLAVWEVVDDEPKVLFHRQILAMAIRGLGNGLLKLGRPGEALDAYGRAVTLTEQLIKENPADKGYPAMRFRSLVDRGRARWALGDPAGSGGRRPAWTEAL